VYDKEMLWRLEDGSYYGGAHKFGFFAAWGATVLISMTVHMPAIGAQPIVSINEWYVQWLFIGPWIGVWTLIAIVVAVVRSDVFTALNLGGALFTIGGLICWFTYHVTQSASSTLLYIGTLFLALAAILFIAGSAVVATLNASVPSSAEQPTTARATVEVTRRGSEAVFDDYVKQRRIDGAFDSSERVPLVPMRDATGDVTMATTDTGAALSAAGTAPSMRRRRAAGAAVDKKYDAANLSSSSSSLITLTW